MREHLIRVLLVDDDSVDAELTRRALRAIDYPRFETEQASSLEDAQVRLNSGRYDVALLDLGLPDSPRHRTLERFRAVCPPELPVIVLTGLEDDEDAIQALDKGAQDYLGKDDVTSELLSRTIRYAMQRHQLLGELESANAMLAQKNERLGQLYNLAQQFVENVSHEFRTPLTVVREFTSIVRDGLDGPVTPKQAEHLEKVLHRTDDLALMVDDMLDISKLEAGLLGVWRRPGRVDEMIDTVRGLVKGRADSKRITLSTAAGIDLPAVYCDEEKARRVILNLAVNAIKFTPEGGTVDIWATADEQDHEITIGVTDTGPGLSQENLAIVFERFRQVDHGLQSSTKGFGLGLSIAKELVALNLGRMDVKSAVGKGSSFSFTLPYFEPNILFERYTNRLRLMIGETAQLSLFSASIDLSAYPQATPVVDEFLQRSVRANDLVVSYDEQSWLLAAACPECDCPQLIDRLTKEWASYLRNSPSLKLPPLEIKHRESGEIGRDREALLGAYLALASKRDVNDSSAIHRTVLVVDDDQEVSQCLGLRLQAAGFEVISAYDGESGLLTAMENQPDAVVLDVRMPKKDGLTVLRELRQHPAMKNTPIVMLSASIRDQHTALEAGASYFVPKPYEASQVLSALHTSLRQETMT